MTAVPTASDLICKHIVATRYACVISVTDSDVGVKRGLGELDVVRLGQQLLLALTDFCEGGFLYRFPTLL